jgi:hypothetical protein
MVGWRLMLLAQPVLLFCSVMNAVPRLSQDFADVERME